MKTEVGILFISLIATGVFAHYLVVASIRLAKIFKVSEAFIGLTVVAMGTSAPEIAVSISAALDGKGALSVGNVIGSNIFNLGFILGLVSLIAPQKSLKNTCKRWCCTSFFNRINSSFFVESVYFPKRRRNSLFCLLVYNLYLWMKKIFLMKKM